jgi:ATP-dependent RNA helicase DDX42
VRQAFVALHDDRGKWSWLVANLPGLVVEGKVLIFVSAKAGAEEVANNLNAHGHPALLIHGDLDQYARSEAVARLKRGDANVLVGTDVIARGLDVRGVQNVVSYDAAKSVDQHVHRCGRTGRMGVDGVTPGTATTLLTKRDADFAADLAAHLRMSRQELPEALLEIARQGSSRGTSQGPPGSYRARPATVVGPRSVREAPRDDPIQTEQLAPRKSRWGP